MSFALETSPLAQYLAQEEQKSQLSFITCGSVDDGKSTLIGRLLFETKNILSDQLEALQQDSIRHGTQQGALDFALLVDGLASEQEQGITIDVAYRFFASQYKKYIIIDAPGHEQYTRNMITGASKADAALLLIDARHGLKEQTKRHSYLLSLLGIKNVLVLINKMDLVDYSEAVYKNIVEEGHSFFKHCTFDLIRYIPISAVHGDNIIQRGEHLTWYQGLSVLQQLDELPPVHNISESGFIFPLQGVVRPHQDFRGYTGRLLAGDIYCGQRVKIAASGVCSVIKSIHLADKQLSKAHAGQSLTIQLDKAIDASRGDVLIDAAYQPNVSDRLQAYVVALANEPLIAGRLYLLKLATMEVMAAITRIEHQVNIHSLEPLPAQALGLNDIGLCAIQTNKPIVFAPYHTNKDLGSFILIDSLTNQTVGAGMIQNTTAASGVLFASQGLVSKAMRSSIKRQKPCVFWFTGLSGAGKSTLAQGLEQRLLQQGMHTYVLDGDNVRHGLCKDLGFTLADRVENVRRIAETAKLMTEAGLIVLVALISPYKRDRLFARSLFAEDEFIEVFLKASLAAVKKRDVKGLYARASQGLLTNFTGVDAEYEAPEQAEITINTDEVSVEESINLILTWLR